MASRETHDQSVDEDGVTDAGSGCPECEGQVWTNDVETVCEDCGLVLAEQPIDHGPEWRSFEDDDTDPERTGPPLTEARHDRGLSTDIGRKTDGNGNTLSGRKRRQLKRLRREHSRGRFGTKAQRNLAQACSEIRRIVSSLGLGESAREHASSLFRTAQAEDLLPGRSIEGMAAGSVYATCRCRGLARAVEEVGAVAQVDVERVLHCYRVLNKELALETVPQQPADFVPRLATDCPVSDNVESRALELAKLCQATGMANGRQPSGVAGACLYRAAQEHGRDVTQVAVADSADSTPVTIRQRIRELDSTIEDSN